MIRASLAGLLALSVACPVFAASDDRPLPPATTLTIGLDDSVATARSMYPGSKVIEAELGRHGSHWAYVVRTLRGSTVRTLKFDASSGQTLVNKRETARGQRLQRFRNELRLLNSFATTKQEAIQVAETAVPGAKAYEVELDDVNDLPVFKVKLLDGARRVVVIVSASDGVVIPMPADGVVDLSFDDAVTKAESSFAGWTVVKVELDDDRNFDDSGSNYNLRLVNAAGNQRRDVQIDANSGVVRRDRINGVSGGNVDDFQTIAAADPAVSFGKAASVAADSIPGSRVREVQLKVEDAGLVYEVEIIKSDGTSAEVYVNATTGQLTTPTFGGTPTPTPTPTPGTSITSSQAAAIALARVPGTTVREISLDTEEGISVYEVKLVNSSGQRTDVKVAVATGAIVRVDVKN